MTLAVRPSGLVALPLILTAVLSAACSSSVAADEPIASARASVIKGKNSDKSQDAVVLLIHYDPNSDGVGECTGTLLAPNLVLTARHCVADTDEAAACSVDGSPLAGGAVRGNHKASDLYVFTGPNRPDLYEGPGALKKAAGKGVKILDDGAKTLCNHDIALVVLKEPIKGAAIAPVRLDGEITAGEAITAVGWGVTDKTPSPDVRQQRGGVKVLKVGPNDDDQPVPPNEFAVGEAICSGDSGGPALASTGAVIGVVSRGGNGAGGGNSQNLAAGCVGASTGNLYSKVTAFKSFILKGYELAEAEPWLEGEPDPRKAKPGVACTDASECRSDLCLPDPGKESATTCAADCSNTECPEGQTCTTEGAAQVCRAPTPKGNAASNSGGGCQAASGNGGSNALAFVGLLFGLACLTRRKK